MNTCKIRGLVLGEGIPKICVPIVGKSKEEIVDLAKKVKEIGTDKEIGADIVEFRADWFEDILDFEKAEEVLKELRGILGKLLYYSLSEL